MCYRDEQSLDFSGIHLACLTGDNGHGKSTLLDAITWALWGKARARRDDELITLGNDIDEMWVDFEFELSGQRYRVWRQRSKRGRGQSDLHLYVWNEAGDGWQILDEGGLLERQRQITRTLRMEYDTFVNSAFVLQGRADSFTVKTPAERKEILADILGLSQYDVYEARAKEEAQTRKERAGRLQGEIEGIDRELERRPDYEAQLSAARAAVAVSATALRAAEGEQARQRQEVTVLHGRRDQLTALRGRLGRARRDLEDVRAALATAQARRDAFQAVLARREEIEQGWAALQDARDREAAFNARLLAYTQLQEHVNGAQREIDAARAEAQAEGRRLAGRREELARKVAAAAQHAALLEEARAALAQLETLQARREEIAIALTEAAGGAAAARAEMERAKAEGQAAKDKIEMMRAAETAACPLCNQPLTADHRDAMLADLEAERSALAERYRAAQTGFKALSERRGALEAEDGDLSIKLRARDARQRQIAQAEAAVAEGEQAAEEQARIGAEIAALDARLAAGDFAGEARVRLAAVLTRLAEIGYDAAAHTQARDEVQGLSGFDARYQRQLLPAVEGIGEAQARAETLAAQLARGEEELAEEIEEERRLQEAVDGLPALEASLAAADAVVAGAAGSERRARQQEGAAMQQIAALEALGERRAQCRADLEAINAEIGLFNELREAFGKKGIQAMIIESAIPEVETEANRLLGRMTEGRMSLRLEMQREKVTGGVAETLDIIIADELGSRAYEMYSGGESFRANLALRIAISKLLAHRAGAQLQTLIIDEGFGTQDTQGRGLLVEAINSIQHDFERIIVITHIEELKDMFPARIDVVKTPSGSRISVN
jgi:exonuclease SbcC